MYGPAEIEVERRVGMQYEGLLRVRRTLLVVSGLVAAVVVAVVIAGDLDSAAGIAMILLLPLVFFLAVLQPIVLFTRPKEPPAPSGGSQEERS